MDFLKQITHGILDVKEGTIDLVNRAIHGNTASFDRATYGVDKVAEVGKVAADWGESIKPHKEAIMANSKVLRQAEKYAKDMGYELPKGILPAIYVQESTAGTNKASYNPKIGKFAYEYGLTEDVKKDLLKEGIKVDFNTRQGAANAAAILAAKKMNYYDYDKTTDTKTLNKEKTDFYKNNPDKFYSERWNAGGIEKKFGKAKVAEVEKKFSTVQKELSSVEY